MSHNIRNRIIGHRTVRCSDIKPHPQNWRTHPENQKAVLGAMLDEVGFARSLLAYEDPEWGLTLIDGHLRRDTIGDELVTVEVLDVTRDEARKLLLSVDPLAALAGTDDAMLADLVASTSADNAIVAALWDSLSVQPQLDVDERPEREPVEDVPEQFLVLITCKNETHQAEVLKRCNSHGWKSKALRS